MNNKTLNNQDKCHADVSIAASDAVSVNKVNSTTAKLERVTTATSTLYNGFQEWQPWSGSNKCPKCDGNHIEVNTMVVLTTYPAQSQLRCKDCGYQFGSGIFAANTDNTSDATDKRWQHDQSILNIPKVGDWPPGPQVGDAPWWPSEQEPPSYPDITIPRKGSPVGWICPKCGRCYAPHVSGCSYCNRSSSEITY